jgi:hypothetical protein
MKNQLSLCYGLAGVFGLGSVLFLASGAWGQAPARPRLPGTIVQPKVQPPATTPAAAPQVNPNAIALPKKRLQVGVVDWQFRPDAGRNPGNKDLGPDDAVIVFTADDTVRMSAGVKPSFELFCVELPRIKWVGTPKTPGQGNSSIEFRPDPKAGYTLYKAYTVLMEWLPEGQAVKVTTPDTAGTYVLHADFIDAENKAWYFGKAVFRLKTEGN